MDDPIVSSPEHQVFAECSYSSGPISLSGNVTHIGTLYTSVSGGQTESETYTLLGARFAYRPTHGAEIFVTGENLTDESYEINKGYPMPGVTILAGISLRNFVD